MKEVVSSREIIITFSTQEIIRHKKFQVRFLDKLVLKQKFDHKLMINAMNSSMMESTTTYDYDYIDNGVHKSTLLEPTIKHLMKERSSDSRAARNLVGRGQNILSQIFMMGKVSLKPIIGCSRYITTEKQLRKEFLNGYFLIPMSMIHVYAAMLSIIKYKGSVSKNVNGYLC